MSKTLLLAAALLACVLSTSHGATLLTQNLAPDRNDYTGTVGFRFTVGAFDLVVTALGYQDADGLGLGAAHQVAIWDSSGTLVSGASVTVPLGIGGTLSANYRYVNLTGPTVTLLANQTYTIGAEVTNGGPDAWTDAHGQANFTLSGDATVSVLGGDVHSGGAFAFPGSNGNGDELRWAPGNMQYTVVPEPAAALLGGVGLLALLRRRR